MKILRSQFQIIVFLLISVNLNVLACSTLPTKKEITVPQEEPAWLKPGLLNSKRIELKFSPDPYGVETIAQANPNLRLSNLHSVSDGKKIARTIALTQFHDPLDESLTAAHSEIMAGGSIGVVLTQKHGFNIKKDIFFVDEIGDLPSSVATLMHTNKNRFASIIYDLSVEKNGRVLPYCTILEVYSPEFLNLAEVKTLYKPTTGTGVVEDIAIRADARTKELLSVLRQGMESVGK